jgi:predicted glutamine amidotransferase
MKNNSVFHVKWRRYMCIIIYKPAGAIVCPTMLRNSYENNKDGFGLMYSQNGRIVTTKGLLNLKEIMEVYNSHKRHSLAVHFRYTTVGKTIPENVHPVKILSVEEDGVDLYMMHNGTISDLKEKDGISDTVQLADLIKDQIRTRAKDKGLEYALSPITDETKRGKLSTIIGKTNKLLFMTGDGSTYIVNPEAGLQAGDIWFSNDYSLKPGYREKKNSSNLTTTNTTANTANNVTVIPSTNKTNASAHADAYTQQWGM